jgi:hypothetical protein
VLRALGLENAWTPALAIWRQLLGYVPGPRAGAWSICLPLHSEIPAVRVGSTIWALQPEDREKRSRLVRLVERLRGDARFCEAIYKLMESVQPAGRKAVGRAAEVEVVGGELKGAEFYLSIPETSAQKRNRFQLSQEDEP